jgi:SMI1 / KNR4 family (SUKH-1)
MSEHFMKQWISQIREFEGGAFQFHPAADPSDIAALEEHLGFALPEDLKGFYLNFNGISGENNGWKYQIIGSTKTVIGNLDGIRRGQKTLNFGFSKTEIIYPTVFKSLRIIPLDDADNVVGVGAFYLIETFSVFDRILTAPGIYRYFASQANQVRNPDITLIALNLGKYLAKIFELQDASEGVLQ